MLAGSLAVVILAAGCDRGLDRTDSDASSSFEAARRATCAQLEDEAVLHNATRWILEEGADGDPETDYSPAAFREARDAIGFYCPSRGATFRPYTYARQDVITR
jgi:hypothetical protein